MHHRRKSTRNTQKWLAILAIAILICYAGRLIWLDIVGRIDNIFANEIVSPLPYTEQVLVEVPVFFEREGQDFWIDRYARKYATHKKNWSYLKYQLHCLANKESTHHENKGTGDHGLADGLYQYHASTWVNFRKIMIQEGLVDEIGDLHNDRQAIETTAWALADNRDNNWGPIVNRGECK